MLLVRREIDDNDGSDSVANVSLKFQGLRLDDSISKWNFNYFLQTAKTIIDQTVLHMAVMLIQVYVGQNPFLKIFCLLDCG